ncbi:hypothetical protein J6P59_06015 [bacterium]|nr:hypothetical protein [bacterium]
MFQLTNLLGEIINIQFLNNNNNELEKPNSNELKKILNGISNFIRKYLEKTKSYNNKYDLKPTDYLKIFKETRNVELSFDNLDSICGYKTKNSTKNKKKKDNNDVEVAPLNNLIFICNFLYKHNKLKLEETFNIYDISNLKKINTLFSKFTLFLEYTHDKAYNDFKNYLISD